MDEEWDRFPSNIKELLGSIKRESYVFPYSRYEVWKGGRCISSGNSDGFIKANVIKDELCVEIANSDVNSHIAKNFSFSEISTNLDRIMWSKDILNLNGKSEYNIPDISSLFYRDGLLSKVTFTIHDPNSLIEFYLASITPQASNTSMDMNTFTLQMGCHSCRHLTPNAQSIFMSEKSLKNLSFFQVKEIIDPKNIECPVCQQVGQIKVFNVEFDGYIYDFENPAPVEGIISIVGQKEEHELSSIKMGADIPDFSGTDYLNAINYFLYHLEEMKESPDFSFSTNEKGQFYFDARYSTEGLQPPSSETSYISKGEIKAGNGRCWGVTYDEVKESLENIRNSLKEEWESLQIR